MSYRVSGARVGATMAATALVVGCASMDGIAPRSTPAAPQDFKAHQTFGADVAEGAWPAADWWTELGDAQLDALEREALEANPSLRLAQARVDKARGLADVARSSLMPHVDADVQMRRERFSNHDVVPEPLAGSWRTQSRLALDFAYELDFLGKNRAAVAAAVDRGDAARVEAFAARLVLSVAVARAYVQLARLDDQLDITTTTLRERQQIYGLTRDRVAAGIDTRVELKQAEAALPATREEITALSEATTLTRHQLAALCGQGPDRGLEITRPKLQRVEAVAALPSRLPAALLGRRPDVVASRLRAEAAAKDIGVAKAQFYPDVDLLAFVGVQSLGLSRLLTIGSAIAGMGPVVTLPVFDGGRLRGNLTATDAEYDVAVERYNEALVDGLRDIGDAIASIRSVAAQNIQQSLALDTAREAYDLALARYREGIGDYLSVLSAEAQVLAQRRREADLRARAYDNRINLVRALGGGFETRIPGDTAVQHPSASMNPA
jgi:NodT family efflux transporter outer membrane factor (OMF) lipoprotein